jgi:hypothetical protein
MNDHQSAGRALPVSAQGTSLRYQRRPLVLQHPVVQQGNVGVDIFLVGPALSLSADLP